MENGYHHQQQWQLQRAPERPNGLMPEPADSDYCPPGFRFNPKDEELVSEYLVKFIPNHQLPVPPARRPNRRQHIIPQVDIYRFDTPEDIKELYPLGPVNNKNEWFFITQLSKKYPNGGRPSRICGGNMAGYWKPTGKDKVISVAGVTAKKKSLEYFRGKSPGKKTDWKMYEYKIYEVNGNVTEELMYPVICKIYINTRKKDKEQREAGGDEEENEVVVLSGEKKDSDQSQGSVNSAKEGGANVNPPDVGRPVSADDRPQVAVDENVQSNNCSYQQFDETSPFMDPNNGVMMNPYDFDGGAAWYEVNHQPTTDYYSLSYDNYPGPGFY